MTIADAKVHKTILQKKKIFGNINGTDEIV